jgi:hypothetical protein
MKYKGKGEEKEIIINLEGKGKRKGKRSDR